MSVAVLLHKHFTYEDLHAAWERRGLNCGPAALAVIAGVSPEQALDAIPQFDERRYTSPTMMASALRTLGIRWMDRRGSAASKVPDAFPALGLVRIQWCGPWTAPDANPRWAYRQTHWIASVKLWHDAERKYVPFVYDVNSDSGSFDEWERDTVPRLIPPRGDGRWFPTHLWDVERGPA